MWTPEHDTRVRCRPSTWFWPRCLFHFSYFNIKQKQCYSVSAGKFTTASLIIKLNVSWRSNEVYGLFKLITVWILFLYFCNNCSYSLRTENTDRRRRRRTDDQAKWKQICRLEKQDEPTLMTQTDCCKHPLQFTDALPGSPLTCCASCTTRDSNQRFSRTLSEFYLHMKWFRWSGSTVGLQIPDHHDDRSMMLL